jgi:hypothetical protein
MVKMVCVGIVDRSSSAASPGCSTLRTQAPVKGKGWEAGGCFIRVATPTRPGGESFQAHPVVKLTAESVCKQQHKHPRLVFRASSCPVFIAD